MAEPTDTAAVRDAWRDYVQRHASNWPQPKTPTYDFRFGYAAGVRAGRIEERAWIIVWAVAWLQELAETENAVGGAALLGAADQFESDLILHEAADRLAEEA